jgi:hypothetical protein
MSQMASMVTTPQPIAIATNGALRMSSANRLLAISGVKPAPRTAAS